MPRARHTLAFCAFLGCMALPVLAEERAPFRFPEQKSESAELSYRDGLPVLIVEGTPEEIGAAVGSLALKSARKVADYPLGVLNDFGVGWSWHWVLSTGKSMYGRFPKDYKAEVEAMIRASGADRDGIIAGNTLFDIKKIINCSALSVDASRSATDGPLMGRNLDYPSLGYIHKYSLVTVYKPKGKRPFATIGFPGLAGAISGMNDAGLAVAVQEVPKARAGEGPRFNSKGMPYALCFRRLLEECATIDEAKTLLEKLPRTSMMNLVVADRKGVGVFEITPKSVVLRRDEEGVCACTNHFVTGLKAANQPDIAYTFKRFEILESVRDEEKKVSVEEIHRRLHRVNLGSLTLQTMVFEPKTLKLHLAIGKAPSSAGKLRTLELGPLFGEQVR